MSYQHEPLGGGYFLSHPVCAVQPCVFAVIILQQNDLRERLALSTVLQRSGLTKNPLKIPVYTLIFMFQ